MVWRHLSPDLYELGVHCRRAPSSVERSGFRLILDDSPSLKACCDSPRELGPTGCARVLTLK